MNESSGGTRCGQASTRKNATAAARSATASTRCPEGGFTA
jgi:hypothetical protein